MRLVAYWQFSVALTKGASNRQEAFDCEQEMGDT